MEEGARTVRCQLRMDHATAGYLCGKQKSGVRRLEAFTRARINVGFDVVDIEGLARQVELARLCIDITLQQRRECRGRLLRFEDIECRPDVSTLDVPVETVGYVLGSKGASMRRHEERYGVFMFFDNDNVRPTGPGGVHTKRLYIIGAKRDRDAALAECQDAARSRADTSRIVPPTHGGNLPGMRPPRSRSRSRERSRRGREGTRIQQQQQPVFAPSRDNPYTAGRGRSDDRDYSQVFNYNELVELRRGAGDRGGDAVYIPPARNEFGTVRDLSHHSVAHRRAKGDLPPRDLGVDEFGRVVQASTSGAPVEAKARTAPTTATPPQAAPPPLPPPARANGTAPPAGPPAGPPPPPARCPVHGWPRWPQPRRRKTASWAGRK